MAWPEKGLGDAGMNKRNLTTFLLVIIGVILIVVGVVYLQPEAEKNGQLKIQDQFGQEMDLDYLILQMEHARDSHQFYIDHPEQMTTGLRIAYAQRDWVNIYNKVIEVLRSK